jgi:hypothetical protein
LLASVAAFAIGFGFNKFIMLNEYLQMAAGVMMFAATFLFLNYLLRLDEEDIYIVNRIGAVLKRNDR